MGVTALNKNRAIRQQALREQLEKQGHLQHVLDLTDKLSNLDTPLENVEVQRLKTVIDTKIKLMNKYIPDLRSIELSGDQDNPLLISTIERTIVKTPNTNS